MFAILNLVKLFANIAQQKFASYNVTVLTSKGNFYVEVPVNEKCW
jgi:hypothetical protein